MKRPSLDIENLADKWLPVPRVGEHVLTDAVRRRVNNVVYDLDTRTVVVEAA